MRTAVVLLDIEGTIAAQSFVMTVMVPYARAHLARYLERNVDHPAVRDALDATLALAPGAEPLETLTRWMDEDRKATPLKTLQGLIWAEAYAEGAFRGHIYPDALAAMQRWKAAGLPLYIYSSGSRQAQLQYFEFNEGGDLRLLFEGHFDTEIGAKLSPHSYASIAKVIGRAPSDILFLSDNARELDAAGQAGLATVQVVKDGTVGDPNHAQINDFSELHLTAMRAA